MTLLLTAFILYAVGIVLPLALYRWWSAAHAAGIVASVLGAMAGIAGAIMLLVASPRVVSFFDTFPVLGPWSLRLDAVAGLFLLSAFVVSGASAVFASGYLRAYRNSRLALWLWPCFNTMVASIALALLANSVLLFLLAWEALTIASFVLVIMEHERLESRKAAWLYLLASHAGTAFLIAFFALNHERSTLLNVTSATQWWLLILPLLGFGIKAGIVPVHVWLPEAHPAAPSHVSAVMSGAMVSVGIYGIFRILNSAVPSTLLGTIIILFGAATAVAGGVQAVSAGRIKRLLAYSTVENSGIMLMGMGLSLLAATIGKPEIAFLALAAVLAHVLVHGVFKASLFLGAGVVQHATGTGNIDEISGLARDLPGTATAVMIASATASAAPPFGGFISEFLLYLAAVRFLAVAPAGSAWAAIVMLVALALSGACALAAYVKLYGIPFLGRSRGAVQHLEWGGANIAQAFLAGLCVLFGVVPALLLAPPLHAVGQALHFTPADSVLIDPLRSLARVNALLLVLLALSGALLALLRTAGHVRRTRTWNCGYTQPLPRAQYTGTSLVEPLTLVFQPSTASGRRADPFMRGVYRPASYFVAVAASKVRRIQHGRLHWYLLYIFGALAVALLIEFVGRS